MTPIPEATSMFEPLQRWLAKRSIVLWVITMAATLLGFRLVGPSQDIAELKARISAAEGVESSILDHQKAEEAWMCLHSTKQEKALLPDLRCR